MQLKKIRKYILWHFLSIFGKHFRKTAMSDKLMGINNVVGIFWVKI